MRIYIKISEFLIVLVLFFSCTKKESAYTLEEIGGVRYYKNTGEPSGKYRPVTSFLFELKGPENVPDSMKGFGYITDVIADLNDNIYILDGKHAVIKKYNKDGIFERYFPEQSGNNIEHFMKPTQFTILYDTIMVYDSGNSKYTQYLSNGTFIQSHLLIAGLKPVVLKSDGKTNLSTFVPTMEKKDGVDYSINRLCVLNDRMKIEYIVHEIKMPVTNDFFFPDVLAGYSLRDGIFYILENTSDFYRIFVTDNRGKKQYVIEKKFIKVPYNDYEREMINEFVVASKFPPLDSTKTYYKKAVNTIEIDKKNRIWAQPSIERTSANQDSFYVDIFKDGIFINRTVLDFIGGNEYYKLMQNRIYVISEDRRSLRVYDYE